jgi:hypothetical protein
MHGGGEGKQRPGSGHDVRKSAQASSIGSLLEGNHAHHAKKGSQQQFQNHSSINFHPG